MSELYPESREKVKRNFRSKTQYFGAEGRIRPKALGEPGGTEGRLFPRFFSNSEKRGKTGETGHEKAAILV
jgi:hypothetical protein